MRLRIFLPALILSLVPLSGAVTPRSGMAVTRWAEADALFHRDPRWLGADGAHSVDLGGGRILWLFADSFVAEEPPHTRRHAAFIRNSVAIQHGANPLGATMTFAWRHRDEKPASFFPEDGTEWFWPGDGVMVDGTLLVFLMKVRAIPTGLHFDAFDWAAVVIDNPGDAPATWRIRWLERPGNPFRALMGTGSVFRDGSAVYAFGAYEDGSRHDVCLVRWRVEAVKHGDLTLAEWWVPEQNAWVPQAQLQGRPAAVMSDAQTEFTVEPESRVGGYLEIQTRGFGAATIAFRTAPSPTGPWSELTTVYRPEERAIPEVMIYAGKAHPELLVDGLAVTYVANASWERVLDDATVYYPRFLKIRFGSGEPVKVNGRK